MRQPLSRRCKLVKVIARDGEAFEHTLARFRRQVSLAYRRPWHKRRYGYYEKPSTLRCKQNRTRQHNRQNYGRGGTGVLLPIDLDAQFRREGPTNAKGR
ncbi:MAG: ribosomal protein S21 [Anaerolineae bacterium]|nr:ribosomal protein S21 [Anaerolineae bacterium]